MRFIHYLLLFTGITGVLPAGAQGLKPAYKEDCDCYGYEDSSGQLVVAYQYASAGDFSEGMAYVRLNRKSGFIDQRGKLVVPLIYDYSQSFSDGQAAVKLNGKWGFIDTKGKLIVPCTLSYDEIREFHEGLAPVRLNGKWGYIDKKGNPVIDLLYDRADIFREGLAAVKPAAQELYGYINKKGELVIAAQFKSAYPFYEDGTAMVSNAAGKVRHINKAGKVLDGDESDRAPAAAALPAPNAGSTTAGTGKIPFSEADKANIKMARESGNWEYIGWLYIDHGEVEEGTALIKKEIEKGNCFNCGAALAYRAYISRYPPNVVAACEQAGSQLKNQWSVQSGIAALRKMDGEEKLPMASYQLAKGFENGYIHRPEKEIDSAIYYYQKAARQGFPPAMYALGLLYQYGSAVPAPHGKYAYLTDKKQARYWFNESAKTGNTSAAQKVAFLDHAAKAAAISEAYNKGYDAFEANNFQEAYQWWRVSALEGNEAAGYMGLGILHHLGKAPGNNLDTALRYYQKAADLGMTEALAEKQKILNYYEALKTARQKAAVAASAGSSRYGSSQGDSYDEWWEKTYGRGGSQNRTPMPDNNVQLVSYRSAAVSEADRHQRAMAAIQRSLELQESRNHRAR